MIVDRLTSKEIHTFDRKIRGFQGHDGERSFVEEVKKLRSVRASFSAAKNSAVTKALLESGVAYVAGYQARRSRT